MKDFLTQHFFKFIASIVKLIGKVHMPWTKKILRDEQIRAVMNNSKQGDILLVRAGGYLSSVLLGKFSHVAMKLNQNQIFDSKGIGVSRDDILSVLVGYTRCVVMRPRFTAEELRKAMARVSEIEATDAKHHIKYNYSLIEGNKVSKKVPDTVTCSQLQRDILNTAKPNFLDLRKRFGFMSIAPEDFYKAHSKFDEIYDTEK